MKGNEFGPVELHYNWLLISNLSNHFPRKLFPVQLFVNLTKEHKNFEKYQTVLDKKLLDMMIYCEILFTFPKLLIVYISRGVDGIVIGPQ